MTLSTVKIMSIAALISVLVGCASTAPPPPSVENTQDYIEAYLIGIGDSLRVDVYRQPELSTTVTVRPDGKITVPVAGEIFVGSKTPEQVSETITSALAEYVRDPLVTVTVGGIGNEYNSRVRITGAVGNPSTKPFRTGMTVLDIILEAGGITQFAAASKTIIYRRNSEKIPVRLDRILNTGDLSTNYQLQPGDIITVPERLF